MCVLQNVLSAKKKLGDKVIEPSGYVEGGHGAALQEKVWDSIAKFIVTGEPTPTPNDFTTDRQVAWISYSAEIAPVLWLIIAAFLVGISIAIHKLIRSEWKKTLALVTYFYVVWFVFTEV